MSKWPYNTARWQRLRRLKLRTNPLCEDCMRSYTRLEPAAAVDHIIPINSGGDAYPPLEDLRSLCASCHNTKTRAEQLGRSPPIKGCDVHGYPLDPRHPWYSGSPLRDEERLTHGFPDDETTTEEDT